MSVNICAPYNGLEFHSGYILASYPEFSEPTVTLTRIKRLLKVSVTMQMYKAINENL